MTAFRLICLATMLLVVAGAPPLASAAGTDLRRFEAFGDDGAPTVAVRKSEEADSCSASFVNSQSTALRCFAGNLIRDPCFIDPEDSDRAVCTAAPFARSSVEMLGVEAADDGTRNKPSTRAIWAIELRSGGSCTFASGASSSRNGKRLNYFCDDDRFLWGVPNRSRAVWTILRSKSFTGRKWRRAKIDVAWR